MLLIVFVFDPLAIAMVVAANFAFSREENIDELKDIGIDTSGMNRLEKLEALNSKVIKGLSNINELEGKINSSSRILNSIRNKIKGKK